MSTDSTVAVCDRCGVPLIWTFAFFRHEYYCLECGRLYTMFGASRKPATPDRIRERDKRHDEWRELFKGLVGDGALYQNCEICVKTNQAHQHHLTQDEAQADYGARQRLKFRVTVL